MNPNNQIIQTIRKLRELRNLTQEQVATALFLTQNGYSKIERGQTELTINKFAGIAKVFNMTMQEILEIDGNLLMPLPPPAKGNEDPRLIDEYLKVLQDKIRLLEEKVAYLEKELMAKQQ
jgi:transcriptional regulator with XRE-family HTH domain